LLSDYLQRQNASYLGNYANTLTNEANYNSDLQKWLSNLQLSAAGQLGNLGTSRLQANQWNTMLPYESYIPAYENLYNNMSSAAGSQNQYNQLAYQQAMQDYSGNQTGGLTGGLMGALGGAGTGFSVGGPWGALIGALAGGASGALSQQGAGGNILGSGLNTLGNYTTRSQYNPTFDFSGTTTNPSTIDELYYKMMKQGNI
jgi:hypothetical protein